LPVADAENDVLGDANEPAAQTASSASDAVSTATGSQHHQQPCDDRPAGEKLTCDWMLGETVSYWSVHDWDFS